MNVMPVVLLAALTMLGACSPRSSVEEMPAINNENCSPEGVAKIVDKQVQNQFQDMCARQNTFKPSPKREW